MLTHGNIVADSAGMTRVTHVAPGVVKTAFGVEEQLPGRILCLSEGKNYEAARQEEMLCGARASLARYMQCVVLHCSLLVGPTYRLLLYLQKAQTAVDAVSARVICLTHA